jgi:hypothetical protein
MIKAGSRREAEPRAVQDSRRARRGPFQQGSVVVKWESMLSSATIPPSDDYAPGDAVMSPLCRQA